MAKEIKKWTTLESRYIIKRPWLTARVDKVQLPDGRINPEHYVLEYPEWVNVIAITRDGEFVMVRQYRHAMDIVLDELCAGVVEQGEAPIDAARRELLEETGYGGGQWREIMTVGQNPSICDNITHCFLAEGVERISDQRAMYFMREIKAKKSDFILPPLFSGAVPSGWRGYPPP